MDQSQAGPPILTSAASPRAVLCGAYATVAALFVAVLVAFRHHGVLGEGDLYYVALGIIDSVRSGVGLATPDHYGKSISFGYLWLLFTLFDAHVLSDPAALIAIINTIGFVAAVISAGLLLYVLAVAYGHDRALAGSILFLFSPVYIDLAFSGHQILTSLACLFAATALTVRRSAAMMPLRYAAAFVLLTAGLTVRIDIFLGLPWFVLIGCNPLQAADRRLAYLRAAIGFAAIGAFIGLQQWFAGDSVAGEAAFFLGYYRLSQLPKGAFHLLLACGLVTALVSLAVLLRMVRGALWPAWIRSKSFSVLLDATVLIVPSTAFWILNPLPARHFVLAVLGIAILAGHGVAVAARGRMGWTVLLAGTIAALNPMVGLGIGLAKNAVVAPEYIRRDGSPVIAAQMQPFWHRAAARERHSEATRMLAADLARLCNDKAILLTDAEGHVALGLYAQLGGFTRDETELLGREAYRFRFDGKELLIVTKTHYWPRDAVADILADHASDGYQLIADPDAMSMYDRTPIPPARRARTGCEAAPQQ